MSNPFSSAKVIADNFNPTKYHESEFRRGDPRFVMSRGSLMDFLHNPNRWICGYKSKDSKSTEWGTLMDCLILTPDLFKSQFAIRPDTYCDAKGVQKDWHHASTTCKQWLENHAEFEIVKQSDYDKAQEAIASMLQDSIISEFIQSSRKQVYIMAEYRDGTTGITVPVKRLLDLVPDADHPTFGKSLADLKTAKSAAPRAWKTAVFNHNYHVQAAMDLDVYTLATGEDRCEFRHIIQESYAPFATGRRLLAAEFIDIGRAKYVSALQEYCRCLKENRWPRYDDRASKTLDGWQIVEPEDWMNKATLQDMAEIDETAPENDSSDEGITP